MDVSESSCMHDESTLQRADGWEILTGTGCSQWFVIKKFVQQWEVLDKSLRA